MRHRVSGFRLGRKSSSRKALYKMLITDFLRYGSIKTTEAKAKAIQPIVEKIISLGKKGTYQDKKTVSRFIIDSEIQEKIFGEISVNLKDRTSGFTRITKLGLRKGDTAPMVEISLVDMQEE